MTYIAGYLFLILKKTYLEKNYPLLAWGKKDKKEEHVSGDMLFFSPNSTKHVLVLKLSLFKKRKI